MLCFVTAGLIEARAADLSVDMDAEIKAASAFVWRGRTLNEDPCLQPYFSIGSGGFSANVWGSWNLTDVSNEWQSSRLDLSVDYTRRFGKHIIRPGFTAYFYHHDPDGNAEDTYECFVSYTYDTLLLPSATLCYDFNGLEGVFIAMSIAHSYALVENKMALDLKLQLEGADKEYSNGLFTFPGIESNPEFQQEGMSIIDATLTASMPISVGKNGALTPALKYVQILDSVTTDAVENAGQDAGILVYSLAYSMTF